MTCPTPILVCRGESKASVTSLRLGALSWNSTHDERGSAVARRVELVAVVLERADVCGGSEKDKHARSCSIHSIALLTVHGNSVALLGEGLAVSGRDALYSYTCASGRCVEMASRCQLRCTKACQRSGSSEARERTHCDMLVVLCVRLSGWLLLVVRRQIERGWRVEEKRCQRTRHALAELRHCARTLAHVQQHHSTTSLMSIR